MVDIHCWGCGDRIADAAFKAVSDRRATPTIYSYPEFVTPCEVFHCCGHRACKAKIERHIDGLRRNDMAAVVLHYQVSQIAL